MRIALLAAAFLLGLTGLATAASDLYEAETIVTGTEEPERTRGFRQGLRDVVVKLTGDADAADDPRLAPSLDAPHGFVARFEYEDRMKGIPVHDEQGTRERPHYLRMTFDEAAMDAALSDIGLSVWRDRPEIAIWLAIETADGGYVLHTRGPEGYGQRAALEEIAARRGLPIRLPPPDAAIDYADVVARPEALPPAELRLIGHLALAPRGYWAIDWRLEADGMAEGWSLDGVTFDDALKSGLARTAARLSAAARQRQRP